MEQETIDRWQEHGITEIYEVLKSVEVVHPKKGRYRYEALNDLRRSQVVVRCYRAGENGEWLQHRVPDVNERDAEAAIKKAIALHYGFWGP